MFDQPQKITAIFMWYCDSLDIVRTENERNVRPKVGVPDLDSLKSSWTWCLFAAYREEIWKLLSSVNLWENGNLHVCVVFVLWNCTLWLCMCVFVHRNYHVFYYLLAGASEEERKSFHLLKPEEYHYLNQVRIHVLTHIVSACTRGWVQLPAFIPAILQFTCLHACSLCVCVFAVSSFTYWKFSSYFVWVQEANSEIQCHFLLHSICGSVDPKSSWGGG